MDISQITKEREDVWYAFSDLFLDTLLDDLQLQEIAMKVASTSFGTEELISIMEDEVAPVLFTNLWVLGGEWAYFDRQKEVVDPIRKRIARVPDVQKNGVWPFTILRRRLHMLDVQVDWQKLLNHIRAIKGSTESGA